MNENLLTVTQLNARIKELIDADPVLMQVAVAGELSNYKIYPSGHHYFTLKDAESSIRCVMFRSSAQKLRFRPENGMGVTAVGRVSVFPRDGAYQLYCTGLMPMGMGDLHVAFEQLKAKLAAEGLFDPRHKKPLPRFPRRIAVITSPRGKAIKDVMRTLRRRYPLGELLVYGVPVEGADAPRFMCQALDAAQATVPAPDVILLVRGGGSYEDLMPFNDEQLARAVAGCSIPVVTGIGHEPDNSIADMVADRRCSTPTAAAEAIAPSVEELARKVENATRALDSAFAQRLEGLEHRLARLADRPLWHDPNYLLGGYAQGLDLAHERLSRALPALVAGNAAQLELAGLRLRQAIPNALAARGNQLARAQASLLSLGGSLTQEHAGQMALAAARLDALSPLKTLSRGYSIAYRGEGPGIVKSVEGIEPGAAITLRVEDGSLGCTVNSVSPAQ